MKSVNISNIKICCIMCIVLITIKPLPILTTVMQKSSETHYCNVRKLLNCQNAYINIALVVFYLIYAYLIFY